MGINFNTTNLIDFILLLFGQKHNNCMDPFNHKAMRYIASRKTKSFTNPFRLALAK